MAQAGDRARWAQVNRERARRGADQHANWSWANAPRGGELQDRQSAQQPHHDEAEFNTLPVHPFSHVWTDLDLVARTTRFD